MCAKRQVGTQICPITLITLVSHEYNYVEPFEWEERECCAGSYKSCVRTLRTLGHIIAAQASRLPLLVDYVSACGLESP
jgi:hypothetical protein